MSNKLTDRIRANELQSRVMPVETAASFVKKGMTVAVTGNISPITEALMKRVERGNNFALTIWSGSIGLEVDKVWGEGGAIARRAGQQNLMQELINAGKVTYCDIPMGTFCQSIRGKELGALDIAIVEAALITKDGNIVPCSSLKEMPTFVQLADKVIVRLNTSYPFKIEGIHDVYMPRNPPHKEPIPIRQVSDRIGTPFIPTDASKIAGIVVSDEPGTIFPLQQVDDVSKKIARNLVGFLREQVAAGRLPPHLLPIEVGVGRIATAVFEELNNSEFESLEFYSAIVPDGILDLIDRHKVRAVSGTELLLSAQGQNRFFADLETYKKYIVLRPLEVADSPEIAARLGIIAINSGIEIDIYGYANCTHIGGTRVINGIGGLGDFAQGAYLSILALPSMTRHGDVSCVVPMVPHVSLTEHSVDIVVTEQGIADLRGLCPVEKAQRLIESCAHPLYRPLLWDYFNRAVKNVGGHKPHLLEEAFSFHSRLAKYGSMKPSEISKQ